VPINTIGGIFAKETGQGLSFQTSPSLPAQVVAPIRTDAVPSDDDHPPPPSGGRPRLQVIK
jgi:stringent starvation protein B